MKILHTIQDARRFVWNLRSGGQSVGLVPTMGALHAGHLSLVEQGRKSCDAVVTTIFVNPTQFAANEDLDKYPRTIERDIELLSAAGCDAVFIPDVSEMYPDGSSTFVKAPDVGKPLEGEFRPTHFDGVATVVLKLFQILPTSHAFFGQKDYQQLRVIETMVRDLNVPIEIMPCPIVRESDGLAMSSRNRYLSDSERQRALCLSRALAGVQTAFQNGQRDVAKLTEILHAPLADTPDSQGVDRVDYAVIVDCENLQPIDTISASAVALLATHVGTTRLIDNCVLRCE
ncbi:pantoate--beta-alanine ligase [Rhodopirellula sp. MGV]|uniref:pantoate--beta-alanine ligase n=1 Tax=Rhodopirellula sp. MGV TaxID=2023130 RepID=UPI000B97542D|nr:pantoate--beta-alanine ligase [Rhodopirellula sp. MGV]OYP34148.1 pantoate--beta-alanine ligase [Rhodopirellula sp. MGV]PNY33584.1 pantoate--beta-alanine ligase [Rhodopirellula baltica]